MFELYVPPPFAGEESEKNIVLISAKLYIFEGDTRTWKDRGRGEIRLNDSAKDEGVFQSRLGTQCMTHTHTLRMNVLPLTPQFLNRIAPHTHTLHTTPTHHTYITPHTHTPPPQ